jgi:hypothetical protein
MPLFVLYVKPPVKKWALVRRSKIVDHRLARSISNQSGFSKTEDLGHYGGVPLLHQRSVDHKHTYGYIGDRVQKMRKG